MCFPTNVFSYSITLSLHTYVRAIEFTFITLFTDFVLPNEASGVVPRLLSKAGNTNSSSRINSNVREWTRRNFRDQTFRSESASCILFETNVLFSSPFPFCGLDAVFELQVVTGLVLQVRAVAIFQLCYVLYV